MSCSVPPEIEQYVQQVVASGRYDSAEDVVRAAFRLLQEQERRWESLRADIQSGFGELERGEGIEMDEATLREFFDDIQVRGRQRYEARYKDRRLIPLPEIESR